jgi:hypothetical protein
MTTINALASTDVRGNRVEDVEDVFAGIRLAASYARAALLPVLSAPSAILDWRPTEAPSH